MKVLMFGWEFPPHISGGLGTACYGLTNGLSYFDDMEILFVVPKAFGDEDQSKLRLIGANDVLLSEQNVHYQDLMEKIRFMEVNSNIIPYTDPEEYFKLMEQDNSERKQFVHTHFSGKLEFTGGYGANLYQEIANYAAVATDIATTQDFDVIHSHDWLIADAFDAMTSNRPYRKGMPVEKALSILEEERGKQFDHEITSTFIEICKAGELDHILGHCGDDRLLMSCMQCGPVIAPNSKHKEGDNITCPACHADYVMKRLNDDHIELEFTGNLNTSYVPVVDEDTVESIIAKTPRKIKLNL